MEVQEVGFYKSKGDANAGRWLQALVSSLGIHAKGLQQQTQLPTGELGARGSSALFRGIPQDHLLRKLAQRVSASYASCSGQLAVFSKQRAS